MIEPSDGFAFRHSFVMAAKISTAIFVKTSGGCFAQKTEGDGEAMMCTHRDLITRQRGQGERFPLSGAGMTFLRRSRVRPRPVK